MCCLHSTSGHPEENQAPGDQADCCEKPTSPAMGLPCSVRTPHRKGWHWPWCMDLALTRSIYPQSSISGALGGQCSPPSVMYYRGVSLGRLPIHPGRNSAGLLVPQTTAKLTQGTGLWEERHSYFEQMHQQVLFLD